MKRSRDDVFCANESRKYRLAVHTRSICAQYRSSEFYKQKRKTASQDDGSATYRRNILGCRQSKYWSSVHLARDICNILKDELWNLGRNWSGEITAILVHKVDEVLDSGAAV